MIYNGPSRKREAHEGTVDARSDEASGRLTRVQPMGNYNSTITFSLISFVKSRSRDAIVPASEGDYQCIVPAERENKVNFK